MDSLVDVGLMVDLRRPVSVTDLVGDLMILIVSCCGDVDLEDGEASGFYVDLE